MSNFFEQISSVLLAMHVHQEQEQVTVQVAQLAPMPMLDFVQGQLLCSFLTRTSSLPNLHCCISCLAAGSLTCDASTGLKALSWFVSFFLQPDSFDIEEFFTQQTWILVQFSAVKLHHLCTWNFQYSRRNMFKVCPQSFVVISSPH